MQKYKIILKIIICVPLKKASNVQMKEKWKKNCTGKKDKWLTYHA